MIKAVIFDCFGVLITDALEAVVAEVAKTQPEVADEIAYTVTAANKGYITRQESSQKVAALIGIPVPEYIEKVRNGEVKNQALLNYIADLRKKYKTGLLSNISIGGLKVRFTPDELTMYFDEVVASGEIGYAKPQAQAYEIAADRLGVRLEECIFVDDRQDYCEGAKSVGMKAILYQNFDQTQKALSQLLVDDSRN